MLAIKNGLSKRYLNNRFDGADYFTVQMQEDDKKALPASTLLASVQFNRLS